MVLNVNSLGFLLKNSSQKSGNQVVFFDKNRSKSGQMTLNTGKNQVKSSFKVLKSGNLSKLFSLKCCLSNYKIKHSY